MEVLLGTAVRLLIEATIVVTMWSMGLQVTGIEILATVSRKSLLARALLANIVLVPLIAFLLFRLFNLPEIIFAGILAYFILREIPHFSFYISSVLIVAGIIIALKYQPS